MSAEYATPKVDVHEYFLIGMVAYEKQGHECVICYEEFKFNQVYVDHIVLWINGGKTTPYN